MNYKVLALSLIASSFAFSAVAGPARLKPKVETTVRTVQPSTRPGADVGAAKAAEGFKTSGALLGAGLSDKQETLDKAKEVVRTCDGTKLVQDIAAAMPSSAESSAVLRNAAVLANSVQNCQAGQKITDPQAYVNFGRLIIYAGEQVEKGAKASDVNVWAQGLKKAIEVSGGSITLEQAKANIAGLQDSECQMIKGIKL